MKPEGPVPEVSGRSPGIGLYVRERVITQRASCYDSTYVSYIILSE